MSMWTPTEVRNTHIKDNGQPVPEIPLSPEAEKAKMAFDLASYALGLAVFAVSLSLYVYLTRSQ